MKTRCIKFLVGFLVAANVASASYIVSTLYGGGTLLGPIPGIFWAGVAVDAHGTVYFASNINYAIYKMPQGGAPQVLAGGSFGTSDGTGAGAQFAELGGIAVDPSGNIYVADTGDRSIRKITPAGVVTTYTGSATGGGFSVGPRYFASFINSPSAVAIDATGNLYVADSSAVWMISTVGVASELAAFNGAGGGVTGIAVDKAGNVYACLGAFGGTFFIGPSYGNGVYKISPSGNVAILAGQLDSAGYVDGPGASAAFNNPNALAVDSSGNVFVADTGNRVIREITPDGLVSTVAGTAGSSGFADGAPGIAMLNGPKALALDGFGDLFFSDISAIRRAIPVANTQSPTRFSNSSARGMVTPDSPLIMGFVVSGSTAETVLVRGVGPSLSAFGVRNPMQAVQLAVYDSSGALVASTAQGMNVVDIVNSSALIGGFPLNLESGDAALVLTLGPGAYTGVATSGDGSGGIVLIETYEVP
jgi:sugar lactone lactonase YvrE